MGFTHHSSQLLGMAAYVLKAPQFKMGLDVRAFCFLFLKINCCFFSGVDIELSTQVSQFTESNPVSVISTHMSKPKHKVKCSNIYINVPEIKLMTYCS